MTFLRRVMLGLFALIAGTNAHAQYVWSGLGPNGNITNPLNWFGLSVPPNDGSASVFLGQAGGIRLVLPSSYSLQSLTLFDSQSYFIDGLSPVTLTLSNGVHSGDANFNNLWFTSNITLNLTGAQTLDTGAGQIVVAGTITGSSPLTLISSDLNNGGVFIFNNTGVGNTYSGNTTLGDGVNSIGAAFWNSQPFGTGTVSLITNPVAATPLIAHGTQTIANPFILSGSNTVSFRTWDAPLTFTGAFTLASNITFSGLATQPFIAAPNVAGSIPRPGLTSRIPIIIAGNIGELGGARSLTSMGAGIIFLTGTNTYSGGTTISGNLVFGSQTALPGTALVNAQGYIGFADATAGQFVSFLNTKINTAGSSGGIGVDTTPGSATATFTANFDFTGFNAGLRIGTATTAIISGTITPQGANYQFGNGGGTLYVASSLSLARGFSLNSTSSAYPLTVYLQGANTYNGPTTVSNGYLVFDGASSISPSTPALIATGTATAVGASYIGYTDVAGVASVASFLSKFNQPGTWGIIGFDTHQGNSTVSISNINLTGFNDGVFIGTITSANIDATTITPSTVTNGSNAANTLRFTAAQNGVLTVNGAIGGTLGVVVGSPSSSLSYSSGTVIMNGSSTYSGGTTMNVASNLGGLTLSLGTSTALGSGALNITTANGGYAGLAANVPGVNLANNVSLVDTGTVGPRLFFTGLNAFTLSGSISGDATTELDMYNSVPLSVTLAGNNSGFLGNIALFNGALTFANNVAAGMGTLNFGLTGSGTATFSGAATAPILRGIYGDQGSLIVPSGTTLNFDNSDSNQWHEFGGVISGSGSIVATAPTGSAGSNIYLYGNNTYSGGTTISNQAVVGLGTNTAAGTGAVTLNAPNGGLLIGPGVTFTNPLTYTAGVLGGFGTYAPSGTTNVTFGTGRAVAPGSYAGFGNHGILGLLTFNTDVTFANGGIYVWGTQDPSRPDGSSLLIVSGNLFISATSGGFVINVDTFDPNFDLGLANLTQGTPYSIPLVSASGTITGFDPTAFTITSANFQNGTMAGTVFTVSQAGSILLLNFTPVPEPSTYVLLGLGLLALLGLRKRT